MNDKTNNNYTINIQDIITHLKDYKHLNCNEIEKYLNELLQNKTIIGYFNNKKNNPQIIKIKKINITIQKIPNYPYLLYIIYIESQFTNKIHKLTEPEVNIVNINNKKLFI